MGRPLDLVSGLPVAMIWLAAVATFLSIGFLVWAAFTKDLPIPWDQRSN